MYTFSNIPTAGQDAGGIARNSQLSSPCQGHAVRSVRAGGTDCPSHVQITPDGSLSSSQAGQNAVEVLWGLRPLWPETSLETVLCLLVLCLPMAAVFSCKVMWICVTVRHVGIFLTTEYTESGNIHFLAYIPS